MITFVQKTNSSWLMPIAVALFLVVILQMITLKGFLTPGLGHSDLPAFPESQAQ